MGRVTEGGLPAFLLPHSLSLPGEAMSGYKKKQNRLPPFIPIFRDMLKSKAWENLTNASRVAYVHLKTKCVSSNPGNLTLSYAEMEKFMKRDTFSRAIKQLDAMGFIVKTQEGGLFRRRNFFSLSDEWKNYKSSAEKGTVTSAEKGTVE